MATWSAQDAKSRFGAMMEAARHEPQTVTKDGKPAVVVLDAAEYARLTQPTDDERPNFVEFLLSMPTDDGEFERLNTTPRDAGI